jgi:hypothetical protein
MVCFKVEVWLPYRRLLEKHGVALFLFPPLLSILVDHANKARGRVSASSQRNCAARVNHVAIALCRWLKCVSPLLPTAFLALYCFLVCSVAERLRTPLVDWYETWRKTLERGAREARNIHRQTLAATELNLPSRPTGADVAGSLTLEGGDRLLFLCSFHQWPPFHLISHAVVSFKALTALIELESLQCALAQRAPTRHDAEFFQPRLGALVAMCSGGVLRPGSVSGLYLGMFCCFVYSGCRPDAFFACSRGCVDNEGAG